MFSLVNIPGQPANNSNVKTIVLEKPQVVAFQLDASRDKLERADTLCSRRHITLYCGNDLHNNSMISMIGENDG
jgi:hypothetical protein